LLYMNQLGQVGIKVIDPRECFLIYDSTVEENVLAGVRFLDVPNYVNDTTQTIFYIYTAEQVTEYVINGDAYQFVDEKPHSFGGVPIIMYANNDDATGAFEKVLTLIDAYDLTVSDSLN